MSFLWHSLLWRAHERGDPRPDVPVLWPGLLWTQDPKVPVVEEVPDHHSDGEMPLGGGCGLWTWGTGADLYPSFPSQVQFHVTIGHTALSLYVNCDFPHWMHYSLICYAITFIVLFGNFYYQTYRRQQPRRDASSSKAAKAVANGALNGLSRNANGAAVMGGKDEKPQENSGRRKRKGRAKRD